MIIIIVTALHAAGLGQRYERIAVALSERIYTVEKYLRYRTPPTNYRNRISRKSFYVVNSVSDKSIVGAAFTTFPFNLFYIK